MEKTKLLGLTTWNFKTFEKITLGQTISMDTVTSPASISNFLAITGGPNTGKSNMVSAIKLVSDLHTKLETPDDLNPASMLDRSKPMAFEVYFAVTVAGVGSGAASVVKGYTYRTVYKFDAVAQLLVKDYETLIEHATSDNLLMLSVPGRAYIFQDGAALYSVVDARFETFGDPLVLMNMANGNYIPDLMNSITSVANTYNICNVVNQGADQGFYYLRDFMTGIGFLSLKRGEISHQCHYGKMHRHINTEATDLLSVILYLQKEHSALWLEIRNELQTEREGFDDIETKVLRVASGHPRGLEMLVREKWPTADPDKPLTYKNNALSDGTVAHMAYKLIMKDPNPISFWVIDNIDTGLIEFDTLMADVIANLKYWITSIDGNIIATTGTSLLANAIGDSITLDRVNGLSVIV